MRVIRKPVEAEAVRFAGWANAEEICRWTGGFFVPRGYEHRLRRDDEFESSGHLREYAEAYIVMKVMGIEVRVDPNSVIVQELDGEFSVFSSEAFEREFQAASGTSSE